MGTTPPGPGLLLVHKLVGPTSATLAREVGARTAAGGAKPLPVCHAGTLDPFACGLLIVAVGQATRAVDLLHDVPKEYVGEVAWGVETDNGDLKGRVVATGDVRDFHPQRLDAALAEHLGWRDQVPPLTSAQRIGGERAYQKAHRGEVFELPARRVFLHEAEWISHAGRASSLLFVRCGRGYYVRALVRDLGRALGFRAHLRGLRRAAIGPWDDPGPGGEVAVTGEQLFPWLSARRLDDLEAQRVAQGQPIPAGTLLPPAWGVPAGFPSPGGPVRGLARGRLVALLRPGGDGTLSSYANLRGGL